MWRSSKRHCRTARFITEMATPTPNRRWLRLTPDRVVVALLALEGFLILSERFSGSPSAGTGLDGADRLAAPSWRSFVLMFLWFLLPWFSAGGSNSASSALLLLVVVVALPCSWLAAEMRAGEETAGGGGGDREQRWVRIL